MFVPDRLRELWSDVEAGRLSAEAFMQEQERLLGRYRGEWERALLEGPDTGLRTGLLREMAAYANTDVDEIERRCSGALADLRGEWEREVDPRQRASIERFYESATTIYELMDWHSLRDDNGPLAYVLGLEIARQRRIGSCLDFGSGVGSGALLFAAAGIHTTLADISSTLLDFCRWRLERRGLEAGFLDLKQVELPEAHFDMILAMDVFEHLADPVDTAERLWRALKPGGLLFARIHAEEDPDRPHHIVRDFEPTFERMRALGLVETWRDGWIWGHQLFEKRTV
jgi:2-polyprenyl-3-methyl-5-hydroxy-6-metoxy-1,4-benzoquinol methylase